MLQHILILVNLIMYSHIQEEMHKISGFKLVLMQQLDVK